MLLQSRRLWSFIAIGTAGVLVSASVRRVCVVSCAMCPFWKGFVVHAVVNQASVAQLG